MNIRKFLTLDRPIYLIGMLFAVALVGAFRQVVWLNHRNDDLIFTLAFMTAIYIIPFLFLIVCFSVGVIVGLTLISLRTRSPLPLLVLIGGIYLVFQIPLLPMPPLPEELHFRDHRAEYEAVVELARNDALAPLELGERQCWRGYAVPEELNHVSAAQCVEIYRWNPHGLVVYFHPLREFYDLVAYVEFDDIAPNPCFYENERYSEPYVVEKIDAHWYLCTYSWN